MCAVCGMQYDGQTSNVRSRMKGHISDYRRFLNRYFSKSDTSAICHQLESHVVEILKFQIMELLATNGFMFNKDSRQLEANLDAIGRHWT